MNTAHLTNEQIQSFVDGSLPPDETASVAMHLHVCGQCRNVSDALHRLNTALRNLPTHKPGTEFTRNVLARLGIVPKPSVLFQLVEKLAYVFGMMIVLGVMITAFVLTGVIGSSQVSQTQTVLNNASNAVAEQTSFLMNIFTSVLQSYLPFVFGNENLKIAIMGTGIVALLALLDKVLKRRIFR